VVFAVARCLSVRLSVTLVYCIQMAEDIVKHLSWPGSPMILVFLTLSADTQFQFSGDTKYKGGGNILRFLTEIAACFGTV